MRSLHTIMQFNESLWKFIPLKWSQQFLGFIPAGVRLKSLLWKLLSLSILALFVSNAIQAAPNESIQPGLEQGSVANLEKNNVDTVANPVGNQPLHHTTQSALQTFEVEEYAPSQPLFSMVLPRTSKQGFELSDEVLTKSTQQLLLRITGQPGIEKTDYGQNFINNGRKWLKSYDRVPVLSEGVTVGEQMRLNFNQTLVEKALSQNHVQIWPEALRPNIVLMGTLVQQGSLLKLNQTHRDREVLQSLLIKADQLAIPVNVPQSTSDWVYPVEPKQNSEKIQEWLLSTQTDFLLSYKLVANSGSSAAKYELSWRLFSPSATQLLKGRLFGESQQQLVERMMPLLSARLVDLTQSKLKRKSQLYLNLLEITQPEQLIQARVQIQEELPTLEKLHLSELDGNLAQFVIDLKGDYQDFLLWIEQMPNFSVMNASEILHQIDVVYTMPSEDSESPVLDVGEQAKTLVVE